MEDVLGKVVQWGYEEDLTTVFNPISNLHKFLLSELSKPANIATAPAPSPDTNS
jgi:hypothetical protein